MAIGADTVGTQLLVLKQSIVMVAIGVASGSLLAFVFTPQLAIPFDVEPRSAVASGAALVIVVGLSVLASLIPASRAARVDPIIVLRNE